MADLEIVCDPSEVPVMELESSLDDMVVNDSVLDVPSGGNDVPIVEEEWMEVQIGPQHFDLLKLIGEGAFGKVLLVRNRFDKESLYAMKVISKKLIKKKNNVLYMKSERDILTKIHHPFIVHLHYAFQSESKLFLVMDFLSGGELFYHLRRRGIILEKEVLFYLAEMIIAIEFLHNKGIIHRDLKPENVLLRNDGHVCITDFGLAKEIGDGLVARTLCGTSEYMAPEMLTRNGYGKGVDWWSLGALCFEMLTGKAPFTAKTQKDLDKKILNDKFIAPSYLSGNTHALLKGMLEKDVNKRLGSTKSTMFSIGGVAALKQHAFFAGLDWQALEALNLTPPIDLSVRYDNTVTSGGGGGSNSNKNTPQKSTTAAPAGTPDGEGGVEEVWGSTAHFDEEFTNRHISTSFIEDTMYSTSHTPVRSRANSGDGTETTAVDEYAGFDFAVEKFECTLQQLREFEAELQSKSAKQNKKKQLKQKNDERRMADEVLKKQAMEKEAAEKKRVEEENRLQKARTEEQRQLELRRQERRRVLLLQVEQNKVHNSAVREYEEKCTKVGKRLKANRKKLRDIQTLEESVASGAVVKLTSEQKDKLKRKVDLEAEIAKDVTEEEGLLGCSPGALLCEDVEELLRKEEEEKGEGQGGKSTAAATPAAVEMGADSAASSTVPAASEKSNGALSVQAPLSDSPVPSEDTPPAEGEAQPEKKSVWVSPRVLALMRQKEEENAGASVAVAAFKSESSESKSDSFSAAPTEQAVVEHHDHKHSTSGTTSGAGGANAATGGCGCGDHLNSSSISKKEFERQKDEWETVSSSSSKNKKKNDKRQ